MGRAKLAAPLAYIQIGSAKPIILGTLMGFTLTIMALGATPKNERSAKRHDRFLFPAFSQRESKVSLCDFDNIKVRRTRRSLEIHG